MWHSLMELLASAVKRRTVSNITVSREIQEESHRQLNLQLERRIAERTERLQMMIEASKEAVVTINQNGHVEEWNAMAEHMFGWSRHEAIGQRLSDMIIPHKYREAHEVGIKRFLATEQCTVLNQTLELSALKRSGEEFPIELSVWPVRCAEGYIFSAFLRDITERKQALRVAKEQVERTLLYRTVLYDLSRMVKTDFTDSILNILKSTSETLGVARMVFSRFSHCHSTLQTEMIYRSASDDIAPESECGGFSIDQYPQYFSVIISNRPVVVDDVQSDPATAELVDNYLIPLGITSMLDVPVWLDGRVVAVICHEHVGPSRSWTTEEVDFAFCISNLVALALEAANRMQTEKDLRQADADVRKALVREQELNELKSRFVSMASHEFRTPLTAILSSAELLEAYSERLSAEKKADLIDMIKTAVKSMTHMLEEVLFIGKSDTGHLQFNPASIEVDSFCKSLLKEIRVGVGKDHIIEYCATGHCMPLMVDPHLLRQILLNLLSNGIKFSPKGSTISFASNCDSGAIVFEVADQGVGIPMEDRANLFSTFHRAGNVSNIQGTGLGLAIVKKCVDLHGGEIDYTSEVGKGTRFVVRIPFL